VPSGRSGTAVAAGQCERPTRERTVYSVFRPGEEMPSFWVDDDEFNELVATGAATRFGRRGHRLRLIEQKPRLRDDSAVMGPSVMLANAAGQQFACAATAGWRDSATLTEQARALHQGRK
jgi:hypothetical protein